MPDDKGTGLEEPNAGTGNGNPADDKNSNPANQDPDPNTKEVVRQRDRNFEKARTLEEEVSTLKDELGQLRGESDKKAFLDELATKYPGVDRSALDYAGDPESAEALAKHLVSLKETAKQKALEELQTVEAPSLDPVTAAQKLKELENTGRLEDVFDIQLKTKH